jgi:protein phosphatase-4 regulatory subunit 3
LLLEHDPDVPKTSRFKHRDWINIRCKFKEVIIPFNSPDIVSKIHQTFRMSYIRDVVLGRIIDDGTATSMNALIFFNQVDIVNHIQNDDTFQTSLFSQLRESLPGSQRRKDILLLLQDLLNLSKNLQPTGKISFLRELKSTGLFDSLHQTHADSEVSTRLITAEILGLTLVYDPSLLRSFLITQQPRLLLDQLRNRFFVDSDSGLMILITDIFKAIFEIE